MHKFLNKARAKLQLNEKMAQKQEAAPKSELAQMVSASTGPTAKEVRLEKEIEELIREIEKPDSIDSSTQVAPRNPDSPDMLCMVSIRSHTPPAPRRPLLFRARCRRLVWRRPLPRRELSHQSRRRRGHLTQQRRSCGSTATSGAERSLPLSVASGARAVWPGSGQWRRTTPRAASAR